MVAYLKAVMEALALHIVEFGDVHGAGKGTLEMGERGTGARRILQMERESETWSVGFTAFSHPLRHRARPDCPSLDVPVIPDEASISAKTRGKVTVLL